MCYNSFNLSVLGYYFTGIIMTELTSEIEINTDQQ